jgi:hypothetical protein
MALSMEAKFPDERQRALVEAGDQLDHATNRMVYATKRVPFNREAIDNLLKLTKHFDAAKRTFELALMRVL